MARIQFKNVSKRYKLGLTRTSLLAVTYQIGRRLFRSPLALTKRDNYLWALHDVSFELEQGQSLGLIGPNGAGKSTILKLLAKITKPTEGYIHSHGKLSALIELGAGFHPDLTGRENIFLNGTILGLTKAELIKRFDEIVAFSELERFIDTPVKRYSSGMSVRLGFSIAACIEPEIMLVDEVLAVGDASFRQKCMERIQTLIENGTTLIFVSHNMGLVKAICEQGLYLEGGEVHRYGNTLEVIDAYTRSLNEQRIRKFDLQHNLTSGDHSHVDITRVSVHNSVSPENNGLFEVKTPTSIQVEYIAYRPVPRAEMVMRIMRTDGLSCCVMYSDLDRFDLSLERGSGIIKIHLDPLQLFPGTYYAVATIKKYREEISLAMGWSDWFSVTGEQSGVLDLDGVFEPHRIWEHEFLADQPEGFSRDQASLLNEAT